RDGAGEPGVAAVIAPDPTKARMPIKAFKKLRTGPPSGYEPGAATVVLPFEGSGAGGYRRRFVAAT
ncbi:MAG: hypothetical protein ACREU6_17490, partial [Steroidobacteraceae bacterium]